MKKKSMSNHSFRMDDKLRKDVDKHADDEGQTFTEFVAATLKSEVNRRNKIIIGTSEKVNKSDIVDYLIDDSIFAQQLECEAEKEYFRQSKDYFKNTLNMEIPNAMLRHLAVVNYLAFNHAEMEVWGDLQILLGHFMFHPDTGRQATGDELYNALKKQYIKLLSGEIKKHNRFPILQDSDENTEGEGLANRASAEVCKRIAAENKIDAARKKKSVKKEKSNV